MTKETYLTIEQYMLQMMQDAAHDCLHIYRVLHQALKLAQHYDTDRDVLIAACLLHDIGRKAQFENPSVCHAKEGGKLASLFLQQLGWEERKCRHVQDCITTHRFRSDHPPKTIEAKILFDADKLDVIGALGIARSLTYGGQVGQPIYTTDADFCPQWGKEAAPSFLREYHFKLIRLYDHFCTPEAAAAAERRKVFTEAFYNELMEEIDISDLSANLLLE